MIFLTPTPRGFTLFKLAIACSQNNHTPSQNPAGKIPDLTCLLAIRGKVRFSACPVIIPVSLNPEIKTLKKAKERT